MWLEQHAADVLSNSQLGTDGLREGLKEKSFSHKAVEFGEKTPAMRR